MTAPTIAESRLSLNNMARTNQDAAIQVMAREILSILSEPARHGSCPLLELMQLVSARTGYDWKDVRYGINYGDAERMFDDDVATSEVRLIKS